jgi:carbamoyl-phosphate synthase large subunit
VDTRRLLQRGGEAVAHAERFRGCAKTPIATGLSNTPLAKSVEVKWRGPFDLECVVKGDKVYLLELHPHFPAWTWFATGVGINLPARLVRRAFDLPVPAAADYEAGKLCLRYTCEMVTDLAMFQKIATQLDFP